MLRWSVASRPIRAGAIWSIDGVDGLLDALAEVAALVAVAQFDGLVLAGGGAGGNGCAADRAVREQDLDFDGGVAAGIEDLAGVDGIDKRHG